MEQQVFTIFSKSLSHGVITEKGEQKHFVEGFISTTDRDLVDDIVTDRALDSMVEQMKDRVIKLDFEHEAFRGENQKEMELNKTKMPLAKAVDFMRVKDGQRSGVKVRWEFNENWKKFDSKGDVTQSFPEVWDSVQKGFYDAFSIAFIPTEAIKKKASDGSELRLLDNLKLLNVALTGNPINPSAITTNVFLKSLDSIKDIEKSHNQKEVKNHVENTKEAVEAKADVVNEVKSDESMIEVKSMLKSLSSEVKALSEKVSAMDKAISLPIQKAVSQPTPAKAEAKAISPLDLIGTHR